MAAFSVESVMMDKAWQMCDLHLVPFLEQTRELAETVRVVFV